MTALVWPIKASLLEYVRGMSDGAVHLDGVEESARGYVFPASAGETSGHRFTGSVRLRGHGGLLDVLFRDPAIEPRGDGWVLTIADPDDPAQRVPFATLDALEPAAGELRGRGTRLTAPGADFFFGPYTLGTPFDDPIIRE